MQKCTLMYHHQLAVMFHNVHMRIQNDLYQRCSVPAVVELHRNENNVVGFPQACKRNAEIGLFYCKDTVAVPASNGKKRICQ